MRGDGGEARPFGPLLADRNWPRRRSSTAYVQIIRHCNDSSGLKVLRWPMAIASREFCERLAAMTQAVDICEAIDAEVYAALEELSSGDAGISKQLQGL